MPQITTKDGTQIFYNDWGKGQPIVFSHGWPLSADAFERPDVLPGIEGLSRHRPRSARPWPLRPALASATTWTPTRTISPNWSQSLT